MPRTVVATHGSTDSRLSPRATAYCAAESLAIAAVREWSARGVHYDRNIETMRVYEAMMKASQKTDPAATLYRFIDEHARDRAMEKSAMATVDELLKDALDAGYMFGLAVGRALSFTGVVR